MGGLKGNKKEIDHIKKKNISSWSLIFGESSNVKAKRGEEKKKKQRKVWKVWNLLSFVWNAMILYGFWIFVWLIGCSISRV